MNWLTQSVSSRPPTTSLESIRVALSLLSPQDRRRYWLVVGVQMLTSLLDLVGVLLIGVLSLVLAATLSGSEMPTPAARVGSALGINDDLALAGLLGLLAGAFLLLKSVVSPWLTRRVFVFLGNRQAAVSSEVTELILRQPLVRIEKYSSQETVFAVTQAVPIVITSTLGSLALLLTEISLLAVLGAVLFAVSPMATLAAVGFFGCVGFAIQRWLRGWSARNGRELADTQVAGHLELQEALAACREIFVMGRRSLYVQSVGFLWRRGGVARADQMFINQLPKYAYEASLVVGAVLLTIWQFATLPAYEAFAVLAVFLAAGMRVLPSMLRVNTLTLSIRQGVAQAHMLFPMLTEIRRNIGPPIPDYLWAVQSVDAPVLRSSFEPTVSLQDITVQYRGQSTPALSHVELHVPAGSRMAVVGATGSGKSTLVDVILGVLTPDHGTVLVGGFEVQQLLARCPGILGYVPQSVALVNGSVRDNVALGLPKEFIDDAAVWDALDRAHIADFLREHREGLDTPVGERGVRLSGGQRQRLGIARALLSQPRLIVFDEATSALDAVTEAAIGETIDTLARDTTVITVAHRLNTVTRCDLVLHLEGGHVSAVGTFREVMEQSPSFAVQARALGIG